MLYLAVQRTWILATGLLPRGTALGGPGRHRATKPRAETGTVRHSTARDDPGRQTAYQICTQGVAGSNPAVSTSVADLEESSAISS